MGSGTYSETKKEETPEEYGARMIEAFINWTNALTPPSDAHQIAMFKEIHGECNLRIADAEDGITEADVEQTSKD